MVKITRDVIPQVASLHVRGLTWGSGRYVCNYSDWVLWKKSHVCMQNLGYVLIYTASQKSLRVLATTPSFGHPSSTEEGSLKVQTLYLSFSLPSP